MNDTNLQFNKFVWLTEQSNVAFVNQIVPFLNFTGIENGECNEFVPW